MDIPIKPPIPPLPSKTMCDHDKKFESWEEPEVERNPKGFYIKSYRYATFRCKKCRQTFRGVPVKL
jgi:hypothetical protein